MTRSTWPLAAAVLALFTMPAATWAQRPATPDGADSGYRIVPIQPYQLLVKSLGGAVCDLATATECTIEMKTIEDKSNGRIYCLAEAPDIKVPTVAHGAGNLKSIVWKLSASQLNGKPLAFPERSGIVVVVDAEDQIDKAKQGLGDGGPNPNPPVTQYYVKTKRNKLNAKSTYLPVVLWNAGPEAELCAAIDPRIVNVP